MTRYARILDSGPQAIFDKHIAVANAACFHFHADLSGAWLGNIAFDQFPISVRFSDLRCLGFHKMLKCYHPPQGCEIGRWTEKTLLLKEENSMRSLVARISSTSKLIRSR